ncbi:FG-GAP repeat domain-containing protein [Streptomyces sp. NPDC002886]|uniref:FG-GAP repeat domain-containing protein n=1 Tax=Streptomyces sp. NPDC002886 TaxID=3364667 RepID=UPI0036C5CF95
MTLDAEGRPSVALSQDEPDAEGVTRRVGYLTTTASRKLPVRRDVTGDGKADVLALDASGELWRYNGTGNGNGVGSTFQSRALVFKDWGGSYKDVVGAGDLNGDGKADLLSRDTAGRPWLNAGKGTGAFGNRTAVGTEPIRDYTKIS